MKIVTVNISETDLEAIKKLVKSDDNPEGIYPSRSELVRVACREFLLAELRTLNNIAKYENESKPKDFDDQNYVKVPVEKLNENSEVVKEFKIYKIIRNFNDILPSKNAPITKGPKKQKKESPKKTRPYRAEKRILGNPFWERKDDGSLVSKENPNIVWVKGKGTTNLS